MKQVKQFALASAIAMTFSAGLFAQKNFRKDADNAFEAHQYYNAIEFYKKAMAKSDHKNEKPRMLFQVAECYRANNDWKQAETWYAKAVKAKYADDRALLYLAEAKKVNEKYDEAIVEFQNYMKAVPSDPTAASGIKSCELAQRWKDNPTCWQVKNEAQLNTKAYEFSPVYSNKKHNGLLITTKREGQTSTKIDPNTGLLFSDMFETVIDKNGKWSAPAPVQGVNTEANDGVCTFNRKMDKLYFTRCEDKKKKVTHCKIYVAEKQGSGWGNPQLIDFGLEAATLDSFNFRHPALSPDESVMVFSSDLSGGYNEKTSDLWMSTYDKKTKKWGRPVNLGPALNTTGREGFPYIRENGTLYYSSDGLDGMGGLDIFSAPRTSTTAWTWGKPENLQYPLNSSGDDFGIIFDGKKDRGYLTSNREGGKGADDIWSFAMPASNIFFSGKVTDCINDVPVEGAVVRMVGNDGSAVESATDASGNFRYKVQPDVCYVITVLGDGAHSSKAKHYLNLPDGDKGKLSTLGGGKGCGEEFLAMDFCIKPLIDQAEVAFPAVLYPLNSAVLLPESKDSLNFLYQTLIDNPGLAIELGSHTDSRASDAYNLKLSQARAQACVDYLVKEKGIPAARITAKGYGERNPLKLPNGVVLTEKYIKSIKDPKEQERLYQMNRRTVFKVLRWDYSDPNGPKPDRTIVPPKVKASVWDNSGEKEGD